MATIKAINSRASISIAINYITKKEKTDIKLITGLNCSPETAIDEMKVTKSFWNKKGGRQYKHYVQSFPLDENISYEVAHKIAVKLCEEKFKGFEIVIATHKDREHIHSHIIVNSVNYLDGHKIQESRKDLQALKDYSDQLCIENALSVCKKNNEITAYTKEKYKALEKALTSNYKSYVLECYQAVTKAAERATSKEDFIDRLADMGYKTNWTNRKYITFIDKAGKKIRNSNLEKTFKCNLSKEVLENGFKINAERSTISGTRIRRSEYHREIDRGKSTDVIRTVRAAINQSNAAIGADDSKRNNKETDGTRNTTQQNRESKCDHTKKGRIYRSNER